MKTPNGVPITDDYSPADAARDDWEERVLRHMDAEGFDNYDDAEADLLDVIDQDETYRMIERDLY